MIATRSFERRFGLADHVKVKTADLVREIPEEMKPRKIQIGGESSGQPEQQTIEARAEEKVDA